MNRTQKLFPGESFDHTEQNSLIERIKVPKNILYLSDRLPKPHYNNSSVSVEAKQRKTGTFDEPSLPMIPAKPPRNGAGGYKKNKPYLESILKSKDMSRVYKSPKKILVAQRLNMPDPSPDKRSDSVPPPLLERPAENSTKLAPIQVKGMKSHKLQKKQYQRSEIMHEKLLGISNNAETIDEEDDMYIKQLVKKKNPLIRPTGSNINRIAEIYAGGNAQNIIAIQKSKIDKILEISRNNKLYGKVQKAILKGLSYDGSPYFDPTLKGLKQQRPIRSLAGLNAKVNLSGQSPLMVNGYEKRDKKISGSLHEPTNAGNTIDNKAT